MTKPFVHTAATLQQSLEEGGAVCHQQHAQALRFLSVDMVEKAKSGHPGMPMGMADVATVLWQKFLKFDASHPQWPDRDRFVLSAGHGSALLYALLYLTGFAQMTLDQLKQFRQLDSLTPGHPEYGHVPGIETTTGPLGQGLATAVGMALAEKMLAAEYGAKLVDHFTYVMASDGDLMEGISHEAISFAGHHQLHKLIVLFDDNNISIDGKTDLSVSDDQVARFIASGWRACQIDGHDPVAIEAAIRAAQQSDRPTLIACRTQIGFGAPTKAGTSGVHGSPLGDAENAGARAALAWPHGPFEIPDNILQSWRAVGARGQSARQAWQQRFEGMDPILQRAFDRRQRGKMPHDADTAWRKNLANLMQQWAETPPVLATRQLSQHVLDVLAADIPHMIGGSADLTGSNNTKAACQKFVTVADAHGQYLHYGVREHGMAAIMNGLRLHGGFIPYGGTFLIFSDYLKPALRLSALMEQQVIYVLTHDSIGLGEDGPTHQPIEQLAGLRAIPNLNVFRPADGIEVAECWEKALMDEHTPSVLALTRQNILPIPRPQQSVTELHHQVGPRENMCAKGGYIAVDVLGETGGDGIKNGHKKDRAVTLIATGSEVGLAMQVQQKLHDQGIPSVVVSLPCWRLFDLQPQAYQFDVLGAENVLKVAIEAASPFGWERYVGRQGLIMGIPTFGASAPYQQLYEKLGLTPDHITQKIITTLSASS